MRLTAQLLQKAAQELRQSCADLHKPFCGAFDEDTVDPRTDAEIQQYEVEQEKVQDHALDEKIPDPKRVTHLTEEDTGKWVAYVDFNGDREHGKIKNFDNDRQVAWVVYHCAGNWENDHWKDYTAACTKYSDLIL